MVNIEELVWMSEPNLLDLDELSDLAEEITQNREGERARDLVSVIKKCYSEREDKLEEFFDYENQYIQGIATSAYGMITKDLKPCTEKEYGGWGITLQEGGQDMSFSEKQLRFAKLSGDALQRSKNSGEALWYSENSGSGAYEGGTLRSSKNSGKALWHSKNSGVALESSKNSREALRFSENNERSLRYSENSGKVLWFSENNERSLRYSENSGKALWNSKNSERSLRYSENSGKALWNSKNRGRGLERSKNYDESLKNSEFDTPFFQSLKYFFLRTGPKRIER